MDELNVRLSAVRVPTLLLLTALFSVGGCSNSLDPAQQQSIVGLSTLDKKSTAADPELCAPDNGGLTLPNGFCAVIVASNLGRARHMAVSANGDLYVAIDNGPGAVVGGIMALRDTDGDAVADEQVKFGDNGANGIDIGGGFLYFSPNDRIIRYALDDEDLVPPGPAQVVVSGLPIGGDHPRKTVVLDAVGRMYVNFASASNNCQVDNREPFSPGVDPCPELPVRAGVWRFSATTLRQTVASGVRFASELRNMNALAINSADGQLYGAQNGRDQLFENWPTLFDAEDDALLPGEELFRIESGKVYGWPYCYWDAKQHRKVLAPEYGGNGTTIGRCASREDPIADYPAHWAPLGMTFYHGTQFPRRYQGGLFIAFHGSRFDPSLQPAGPGYNVVFQPWHAGKPAGQWQVFADGFAGGNPTPAGAAHRPVDVQVAPDGSMYISDDKAGFIWRVFYVGNGKE